MSAEVYVNGMLSERWNDETRMYTYWDGEGIPIESRPYTDEENLAADEGGTSTPESINRSQIERDALTAYQNNKEFLGFGTVTNAQIVAQVRALTRQMNTLIRVAFNRYDGTD